MKFVGAVGLVICGAVAVAQAGEVHTRATAGTWSSDQTRGTLRGSIANDAGYSFWLMGDPISLSAPVTVIVQIRFVNRVDYGGAGVAIVDANATNQVQRNIRIELSEREDTAGVGGWLGNENHYSGASKRASKDIKTNEWYELALKIDGTKAIGFLDGVEVFNSDVPEIKQLGSNLTIAPFVVEADVEMKLTVRGAGQPTADPQPQPQPKPTVATIASIQPFGKGTYADWVPSYDLKGDRLCVRVGSLRAPEPPPTAHEIGYTVTLDGAIFDNGSRTKRIVVTTFTGKPQQATAGKCETVKIGGTPTTTGGMVDDPYAGDVPDEPIRMPANGRIADMLPKTSKKQGDIEKLFAIQVAAISSPADYKTLYAQMGEFIPVPGKYHFFLEPVSRQWHVYSRLHDSWEPTGVFAGDATFSVVRNKVKVTKKRGKK